MLRRQRRTLATAPQPQFHLGVYRTEPVSKQCRNVFVDEKLTISNKCYQLSHAGLSASFRQLYVAQLSKCPQNASSCPNYQTPRLDIGFSLQTWPISTDDESWRWRRPWRCRLRVDDRCQSKVIDCWTKNFEIIKIKVFAIRTWSLSSLQSISI